MIFNSNSLLHQAKVVMNDLGASCGDEYDNEGDWSHYKCISCLLSGIDFVIETDLWYEGDTTIVFSLRLLPDQKIEVDSQLDKKLDMFTAYIRNLSNTPATIERYYGNTPDESDGYFPSFPDRKNVGTLLRIEFVLGNERREEEYNDLHEGESTARDIVYDSINPSDLKTLIANAVNFAALCCQEIEKLKLG
jgi:hypothetical protein